MNLRDARYEVFRSQLPNEWCGSRWERAWHARLVRERHRLQMRPRPCGVCGTEFEPRFPTQRTCDSCLSRGLRAKRKRGT